MKLRALGAGSPLCRHPLVPTSFLLQSIDSSVVFGCAPGIPAKLDSIGIKLEQVDIWAPLNARPEQVGGLYEVGLLSLGGAIPKPYLAAPERLIQRLVPLFPFSLQAAFQITATRCIHINEEYVEEQIEFIPGYLGHEESYGLFLSHAEILISGETELNDEWLHRYGSGANIILHSCRVDQAAVPGMKFSPDIVELSALPVYLQKKIWLCGYPNDYQSLVDPLPMLFLPQGQWIYDSDRKAKHLEKERFIRENTKRQMGNVQTTPQ